MAEIDETQIATIRKRLEISLSMGLAEEEDGLARWYQHDIALLLEAIAELRKPGREEHELKERSRDPA